MPGVAAAPPRRDASWSSPNAWRRPTGWPRDGASASCARCRSRSLPWPRGVGERGLCSSCSRLVGAPPVRACVRGWERARGREGMRIELGLLSHSCRANAASARWGAFNRPVPRARNKTARGHGRGRVPVSPRRWGQAPRNVVGRMGDGPRRLRAKLHYRCILLGCFVFTRPPPGFSLLTRLA